jgi:Na+-translocating ferredoxin:NAD+ oxidoreductase RnfG subunit
MKKIMNTKNILTIRMAFSKAIVIVFVTAISIVFVTGVFNVTQAQEQEQQQTSSSSSAPPALPLPCYKISDKGEVPSEIWIFS